MENFGLGGNFLVKEVHLQRWSSLTSQSGPTKNLPFHFQKFAFTILLCFRSSNQSFGQNRNGSLQFDWRPCFNRTMSFHFFLIIPLVSNCWFGKMKSTSCVSKVLTKRYLAKIQAEYIMEALKAAYKVCLHNLQGFHQQNCG